MKKQRFSNLELYRVITMLLIVMHHYVVNSGLYSAIFDNGLVVKDYLILVLGAWGKTGINCFVLITGYFMCKSKITITKFLKLLFEIMFYKIIIYTLFVVGGYADFSIIEFVKVLLPIRTIGSNFPGCFLVFYLLIPYLNILIQNISQKQHVLLLSILLVVYTIFGSVPIFNITMNYISWFIVLYLIASYIRLYPNKVFDSVKVSGIATIVTIMISIVSIVVFGYISSKYALANPYYLLADSNKALAVLVAVSSFLYFKNLKISYNKWINTFASSVFGVLMIHANSDLMRQWLWKDILKNMEVYQSDLWLIHALLSTIGIFVVCSLLDMLRIHFIEKPVFKMIEKYKNEVAN